ncbi:MAG: DUF362 domain-containing protein [Armatimonadota bacterium]|nr:DUF362 domain-containing protein [Armatimonadota bacterium]MCX7777293.1 DUF362 domain-containing protein [Armatimonadota bacterium]MDW8024390.1 DUF362 domain-containing protein [Armatimonadota bacterium]
MSDELVKSKLTRRDFIRHAAYAALATSAYGEVLDSGEEKKVKVVLVRDEDALDKNRNPNPKVIQSMLDKAVSELVGIDDPVEAWRRLVKPKDLVGIKTNVWSYLPTPREVEDAIRRRLKDAGVREDRILMDDRGAYQTLANCTALINVRPLRTHYWSGIGGCIKNYIMFVPDPWRYHPDTCAPLGHVWTLPSVKGKTRLNILVVLTPLFHGVGPHHFSPKYTWDYKGLMVSFDPVAIDAIGVRLLLAKRREFFGAEKPLVYSTHHIIYADKKYKVGTSDPSKIQLIKLGWLEGVLI